MSSKDRVLEFLENNKEDYISGEAMATSLGLSRNSIWKAINELRKSGYNIDAISNKGYKLAGANDILSAAGIVSYINDKVRKIYQSDQDLIRIYDTTSSTNRIAKELAIAGMPHGTLVISNEQTEGRGRKDHSFFSPKGGLYMSILLRPEYMDIGELKPDAVTMAVGNSVIDAIEQYWNAGETFKASGRLNFTSHTETVKQEVDFGEAQESVRTVNVSEFIITGGSQAPEDGDAAYDMEDIKAGMAARKARLETMKSGEKSTAKKAPAQDSTKKKSDLGF